MKSVAEETVELRWGNASLLQDSMQRANLQFTVQGHNATSIVAPQYHVTASLSNDDKT